MEEEHQLEGTPANASVVAGPGKRKAPEPEVEEQGEDEQEVVITGYVSASDASSPTHAASKTRNPRPAPQQLKKRRTSAPGPSAIFVDLTEDEPERVEPKSSTPSSCKKKPASSSSPASPSAANKAPGPSPTPSPKASRVAAAPSSSQGREFDPLTMLPTEFCLPEQLVLMRELKFEVRFAIEQLIASGDLKWYQLGPAILVKLRQQANSFEKAVPLLQEKIKSCKKRRNTEPINCDELKEMQRSLRHSGTTCTEARKWAASGSNKVIAISCRVSLSAIVFTGPYEEESNRVVRKFGSDRFLRVSFEKYPPFGHTRKELENAYRKVFTSGIKLGGRTYEMLAWSASQLREGKCYFFASSGDDINDGITADHVRAWLGDFSDQPSLAKYAARMGQAFSKTMPTIEIPLEDCEIVDDIMTENGVYNFTDGCGEISAAYLAEVAQAMTRQGFSIPKHLSAIQIRWGGAKGMLALNPSLEGKKVIFRKSMVKYTIPDAPSEHRVIEVVKPSRALYGALNRQFITLLHALGVPTESFIKLQQEYIDKLLTFDSEKDEVMAFFKLQKHLEDIDSRHFEIKLALLAGHTTDEPYVRDQINALKKMKLNTLQSKARIPIEESRVLQGVADQSGKLKYGQVYICLPESSLPIVHRVAVSKNPCLHPGDFRLLEAVDVPELRHLVGVIVFPTQGPRPHASEIGGGDLDGDQFFVTWNELLLKINPVEPQLPVPDEGNKNRLNVLPADKAEVIPCLVNLFLQQLFNVALGQISNLHQAIADYAQLGANDPHCLELSALFLRAVDAAKTGDLINIDKFTSVDPGQPHFMKGNEEVKTTHQRKTFHSKGTLGQLYDHVKLAWAKFALNNAPVTLDPDLVLEGIEPLMERARSKYKAYKKEIAQALETYNKPSEAELRNKHVDSICAKYKGVFQQTKGLESRLRQASAWYVACYEDEARTLSFPWRTTAGYLNELKTRGRDLREDSHHEAVGIWSTCRANYDLLRLL